jgi:ribosomal protein S18 acetylase RimI-like enzyme
MPYVIEQLRVGDFPEIIEIEKICFPTEPMNAEQLKQLMRRPGGYALVIRKCVTPPVEPTLREKIGALLFFPPKKSRYEPSQNPIIGWASSSIGGKMAHFYSLAVLPEYREGGTATKLLCYAIVEILLARGTVLIGAETRVSNKLFVRFLRRYTLKPLREKPNYYPDGEAAVYLESDDFTTPQAKEMVAKLKKEMYEQMHAANLFFPSQTLNKPIVSGVVYHGNPLYRLQQKIQLRTRLNSIKQFIRSRRANA